MILRKWRSNSGKLLETVPDSLRETNSHNINLSPASYGKPLGLSWNTLEDTLSISIPDTTAATPITKRTVSSVIARVFDVMGWYFPAIRFCCRTSWNCSWPGMILSLMFYLVRGKAGPLIYYAFENIPSTSTKMPRWRYETDVVQRRLL